MPSPFVPSTARFAYHLSGARSGDYWPTEGSGAPWCSIAIRRPVGASSIAEVLCTDPGIRRWDSARFQRPQRGPYGLLGCELHCAAAREPVTDSVSGRLVSGLVYFPSIR